MKTHAHRPGFVRNAFAAFLASVAVMVLLIGLLVWNSGEHAATLTVYCAAGLRTPIEALAEAYEKEHKVKIRLQFAGSQTLLANIEVARRGDLYIPADDSYIQLARDRSLVDEVVPLVEMMPVLAVPRGNPKKIHSLDQLTSGEYRLSLANPDAAAVGKLTRDALPALLWERLKKNARVLPLTVSDVARDVSMGTVDAGIVWDATIAQDAKLEGIAIPQLSTRKAHVCAALLKTSDQPSAALDFARYLAAPDKGLAEFKRCGYLPIGGK